MSLLPPDTFVTFCRGVDLPTLTGFLAEVDLPALTSGASGEWTWVTHAASASPDRLTVAEFAGYLTGFRYQDRVPDPERTETVFLASTPACPCPHGQNYMVPHCAEHPFQFQYNRGGFGEIYFNVGRRRESRRGGRAADLLTRELLNAGILGRDTPGYDADPDFNADGALTLRIIADHFRLPTPPLNP